MSEYLAQFWLDFSKPENMVGHLAYVLLITSMMMRNINWLRALAIMAGSVSAFYYWTLDDKVSMFWETLFTLVNIAQLLILQIENRRGIFSEDEDFFIKTCLPNIERAHARRLAKLGAWTEVQDETILVFENKVPDKLKFIVSGKADVFRDNTLIGRVGRGDFVGEISYLTGEKATATAVVTEPVRYLAFGQGRLRDHLARNTEVRHALETSFNRNLADKLVKSNASDVTNISSNSV